MNSSHAPLRGMAAATFVAAAALTLPAPVTGAPKKRPPAPAAQTAPANKAASASAPSSDQSAAALPPQQKAKSRADMVEAMPVASDPVPPKKRFLKKLFTKDSKPAAAPEPKLAKVKTAKPGPVKEVKPAKPEVKLAEQALEEPKKKRGLFGFLRRDRAAGAEKLETPLVPGGDKPERPDDWVERSVVNDDEIALYEFGPAQANGPDERLNRGTIVKVKEVKRGWALVELGAGRTGYMDASALRKAMKEDFREPVQIVPAMTASAKVPESWAPMAPPPDLPDHPGSSDNDPALLLLPPLELEAKPNP